MPVKLRNRRLFGRRMPAPPPGRPLRSRWRGPLFARRTTRPSPVTIIGGLILAAVAIAWSPPRSVDHLISVGQRVADAVRTVAGVDARDQRDLGAAIDGSR